MCKTWVKYRWNPLWPPCGQQCIVIVVVFSFQCQNWGTLFIFPLNSEFDNNEYLESLEENKDEIKKVEEHLTDVVANTPVPSRIDANVDDSPECSTYIREIKKCKWIKLNWIETTTWIIQQMTNSENSFFPPPHPKTLILIVHTTVFT